MKIALDAGVDLHEPCWFNL